MSRFSLLEPLYEDCQDILPSSFDGWELIPGYINQEHVCTAILKGNEIHFGIKQEYRKKLIQRKRTREYLKPLLERKVFLTTRIILEDKYNKDL